MRPLRSEIARMQLEPNLACETHRLASAHVAIIVEEVELIAVQVVGNGCLSVLNLEFLVSHRSHDKGPVHTGYCARL